MLIKAGVEISRLNREIRRALAVVSTVYSKAALELVVTSTYEGNHSAGSLHYSNDAFDCRYFEVYPGFDRKSFRKLLGTGFDVVFEKNHIHVEYDPK